MSEYRLLCEITLLNERLQTAKAHIHTLKAHIRLLEDKDDSEPLSPPDKCPKCGGEWIEDRDIFLNRRVFCVWCGYNPKNDE